MTPAPPLSSRTTSALPQVIAADNVAGETDYLLSIVARDVPELHQVLASLSTRGGTRLVTYLRLGELKPPRRCRWGSPVRIRAPVAAGRRGEGKSARPLLA